VADKPFPLLTSGEIQAMPEVANIHHFNAKAVRHTRSIGDYLGLEHVGLHIVRLESGDESTQFHFHHCDEEFLYIMSGKGIADIGEQRCEVNAGDVMAFAQHSLPHSLSNPFDEDLVYLMGGTRSEIDICEYPRINRKMYRVHGKKSYVDMQHLHDLKPPEK
jgi:uncharacterized cupin superfamily protein